METTLPESISMSGPSLILPEGSNRLLCRGWDGQWLLWGPRGRDAAQCLCLVVLHGAL